MKDFAETIRKPRRCGNVDAKEAVVELRRLQRDLRKAINGDTGLTPTTKLVGLRLVELINSEKGFAFPSVDALARYLRITERAVYKALAKLDGRHFDRVQRQGTSNAYLPRFSEDASTLNECSVIAEPAFRGALNQRSDKIVNLDNELESGGQLDDGANELALGRSDEPGPVPAGEASSPPPIARQEAVEARSDREPEPDKPSAHAKRQAIAKIKSAAADLDVEKLAAAYEEARDLERRLRRNPGPVDLGFDRYVRRAVNHHCRENREARLSRMASKAALESCKRSVRTPERDALDAVVQRTRRYRHTGAHEARAEAPDAAPSSRDEAAMSALAT